MQEPNTSAIQTSAKGNSFLEAFKKAVLKQADRSWYRGPFCLQRSFQSSTTASVITFGNKGGYTQSRKAVYIV